GDEHGAGKPPRAPELRGHPARAVETVGRGPRLARLLAVEPHDPVRELVRPRRERARELDQEGRARATVVRPDEADVAEPLGGAGRAGPAPRARAPSASRTARRALTA